MQGSNLRRVGHRYASGGESPVELRVLPTDDVLPEQSEAVKQRPLVGEPEEQPLAGRHVGVQAVVEKEELRARAPAVWVEVPEDMRHQRRPALVETQPTTNPASARDAVARKKRNEWRACGGDPCIASPAREQPVLLCDDGNIDAARSQPPPRVTTSGVHQHDLTRRVLIEQRVDRIRHFWGRADAEHNARELRRPCPIGHRTTPMSRYAEA